MEPGYVMPCNSNWFVAETLNVAVRLATSLLNNSL